MEGGIGRYSGDSFFPLVLLSWTGSVAPGLLRDLGHRKQRLSSLSQTNNSKGVSQSNIDRKEKGKREEDEEEKRRVVGGREKKRENKGKKKFRGVGWFLIEFSAGTIVNTREFGQRFPFGLHFILGLY
jgi:hypothetical protein